MGVTAERRNSPEGVGRGNKRGGVHVLDVTLRLWWNVGYGTNAAVRHVVEISI